MAGPSVAPRIMCAHGDSDPGSIDTSTRHRVLGDEGPGPILDSNLDAPARENPAARHQLAAVGQHSAAPPAFFPSVPIMFSPNGTEMSPVQSSGSFLLAGPTNVVGLRPSPFQSPGRSVSA